MSDLERPAYYDIPGCNMNVPELIRSLDLNFDLGCVVKYVSRGGRKPHTPLLQDLLKARTCLQARIDHLEARERKASA